MIPLPHCSFHLPEQQQISQESQRKHYKRKESSKILGTLTNNKNTCNILSSKNLHINSQRLRTDAREIGLTPKALVDCGKKSRAKLRLMTVTRS